MNSAFDLIGLTQLRNDPQFAGIDGSGFSVAVIDSGIDTSNALLSENYIAGFDFINRDSDPDDLVGHGTHVSGTVGARDSNIGVAPDVGLIGLKVGESRTISGRAVLDSLQWVLDNHEQYNIVAVNLSLGGGFFSSISEVTGDPGIELVNRLEEAGIVVVAAAGNNFERKDETTINQTPNLSAPAIYSTLAVGAVWQDDRDPFGYFRGSQNPGADRIAVFSQRLDADNFILAPGALINSTYPDADGLELLPGTSMASPHVAGAVALLQEAALQFSGRLLTPDEIVEILRSTADTVVDGDDEEDIVNNTGLSFPRLNIYNAVTEIKRRADGLAPTPTPDDDPQEPDNKTPDPNGTIIGAFIGPTLDGEPVNVIDGIIGIDGNGTVVGDRDVDIFRFEVASPGEVTIEVGTRADNPEDFDTYLRLFAPDGTEIAANDDIETGINQFSRIETSLEPGVYYVGVSGFNNSSYNPNLAGSGVAAATGNYTLSFDLDNSDPNGLLSGATEVLLGNDLRPLIFPGFIGADFGEPVGVADVDLYRIAVPDDGVLFIDIDTPYETDFVDSYLRFFSETGEELTFTSGKAAASDDDLSFDREGEPTEFFQGSGIVSEEPNQSTLIDGGFDDDGNYIKGNYGHETDSFIGVRVSRGDVYYVGVSDFFNSDYDPNNLNDRRESGGGGLYEFIATFVNNDLNGTITQADLASDLPLVDVAASIGEDEEQNVGNRDVDFWKFSPTEAGILSIDIDGEGVDTFALIFDEEGRLLADNDDNDGVDPLLRYQVEPNQDYYVAITGYGNQNFDPFALGSGSGGSTGDYRFNAELLDLSQANILQDDRFESPAVRSLVLGDPVSANIGQDNGFVVGSTDIDLYRFTPASDVTVNIRAAANEDFSADTFLRLFDAQGNQLAANNDENELTRGSLIRQELIGGTEYIVGVNGNSTDANEYNPLTGENAASGSQGNYTLTVTDVNEEENEVVDPDTNPDANSQSLELFRFRNTTFSTGTYVFVGESERDAILEDPNLSNNFALDGQTPSGGVNPAFTATTNPGEDLIPFFRLKSLDIPGTFLFVSTAEYEAIFADGSDQRTKWEQEGLDSSGNDIPEFYLYDGSSDRGTPFNRFQNQENGTFLYAGAAETNSINNDSNLASTFTNQGVAFNSL